jgi:hypothetical protein
MLRQMAKYREEEAQRRGPEPPPLANPWQPGCAEWAAREAEIAAQEVENSRKTGEKGA